MSFRGYTQHLCESGHYWTQDVPQSVSFHCPVCGKPPSWSNLVDTTNGEREGYVQLIMKRRRQEFTRVSGEGQYITTIYHPEFEIPEKDKAE